MNDDYNFYKMLSARLEAEFMKDFKDWECTYIPDGCINDTETFA